MVNLRSALRLVQCVGLLILSIQSLAQTQKRLSVTVPYTVLDTGIPCIHLRLNRSVDANFIFDTGASSCFISDIFFKQLNLPSQLAVDIDGKPIVYYGKQAQETTISLMELDALQSPDMPFVISRPGSFTSVSHNPVDGLLGTNYIEHFAAYLNTQAKQLTLWPNGKLQADDLKNVGFDDATILPITVGNDGSYYVRVDCNGKEGENIALDTGAALTNLPLRLVRKLKLKDIAKGKPQNTLFGTVTINETHLQTLALGKLIVTDFDVQYSTGRDTPGFFPHIGMDVLSHFRFLLDAPAKKLYLKPIETTPKVETPKPNAPDSKP